ncbi:MAG: hypothetical protein AB7I59_05855 [Geminicoccaceae bacterium]
MAYQVVRYRHELKPEVLALLAHAWGGDAERNARTFVWKFERNPYLGRPLLHLVTSNGRPVAVRALHGAHWLEGTEGTPLSALCVGDLAIDPAHRGRHLFGRLMAAAALEARELGYRHLISLSAGPAARLQSLRTGWRNLGAIATLQRSSLAARVRRLAHDAALKRPALAPLASEARQRSWLRSALGIRSAAHRFRRLDRVIGRAGAARGLALTSSAQPLPGPMAELCRSSTTDSRVRHDRGPDYLAWRFLNPLSHYRFVLCGTDRLDGMVVLETPDDVERDRVRIVLCEARSDGLRDRLLNAVIEAGRFPDLRLWDDPMPFGHADVLSRAGFRANLAASPRHQPSLLLYDLEDARAGASGLPDIAGWRLSMIDSDKC